MQSWDAGAGSASDPSLPSDCASQSSQLEVKLQTETEVARLGSEVGVPTSQIGRRKTMVVHLYKVMVIHDLGDVRGYPLT